MGVRHLVLQRFAVIPASRHQQLDLRLLNRFLLAFHSKNMIAVAQIEIDPAMRKGLLQHENDIPGNQVILHIGFEDFYNFHIDSCAGVLKNVEYAGLDIIVFEIIVDVRNIEVAHFGYPINIPGTDAKPYF